MRRPGAAVGLAVAVLLAAAACSSGSGSSAGGVSTTTTTTTAAPAEPPSPAVTAPEPTAPAPDPARSAGVFIAGTEGVALARSPGGALLGRLQAGVAVPFEAVRDGWARVFTPCENTFWARLADGTVQDPVDVVLDPGHGGNEPGAVGPTGLSEKEINLDVARLTVKALAAEGISAALTRSFDYRITIAARVALAAAWEPKAFVSIHHNADPDTEMDEPGTETFYQFRSAESKRLSGLIYEEAFRALSGFSAQWVGDYDAGAKYRLNSSGGDYYGILRRSGEAGLVASLAELAFLTNPTEEALLRRDDVQRAQADALTRALVRFLRSDDPGSGFTEPYPRDTPAGPGGGLAGCVDPLM